MSTRRQFIQSVPAVGTAFAVAGHLVLNESPAQAQEPAPLKGHFHPKGKAPSKFTLDVLKQAKANLPFADKRVSTPEEKCIGFRSKNASVKLATRVRNLGPFLQASGLRPIIRRGVSTGAA